jgi:transcriptional regulator with XRE-family HTH domain
MARAGRDQAHAARLAARSPHEIARALLTNGGQTTGKRPNPTDVYVGSRVRLRRKMLGLSQEKLGEKLGITFQQIQKYEKGTNRVGASRLQAMSEALNVPVSYFFPDEASDAAGLREDGANFLMDFMSTSEGIELSRAFLKIPSGKVRRKVVELVRALAEETS